MPRKKSEKVVDDQEEFDVDEPSEVEELENNATDDDWTPADEEKKSGRPQRASRNRKPIKLADGKTTSDEDDDDEDEDPDVSRGTKRKRQSAPARGGGRGRGRGRGGGTPASVKKAKADENGKGRGKKKAVKEGEGDEDEGDEMDDDEGPMEDEEESVSDEEDSEEDSDADDSEIPPEFKSGKFVLLKADFDNKEENYPLWKIDGKSLLQKFDKFIHNDEELYKGTTIYAGWSKAIIDTYYPIEVELKTLENGDSTVKFDPSQITPELKKKKFSVSKPSAPAASAAEEEGGDDDENSTGAAEAEEANKDEGEAEE